MYCAPSGTSTDPPPLSTSGLQHACGRVGAEHRPRLAPAVQGYAEPGVLERVAAEGGRELDRAAGADEAVGAYPRAVDGGFRRRRWWRRRSRTRSTNRPGCRAAELGAHCRGEDHFAAVGVGDVGRGAGHTRTEVGDGGVGGDAVRRREVAVAGGAGSTAVLPKPSVEETRKK